MALILAGLGMTQRFDAEMVDVKIWIAMLGIQVVPYLAAVLLSLISGMPKLPASLVGVMSPLKGLKKVSGSESAPTAHPH